jgi:hypothetical protein
LIHQEQEQEMRDRRKNLAGGIPKPGTNWVRDTNTLVWRKQHFAITECSTDGGGWTYQLHAHSLYIGTYHTFKAAAVKANSYNSPLDK